MHTTLAALSPPTASAPVTRPLRPQADDQGEFGALMERPADAEAEDLGETLPATSPAPAVEPGMTALAPELPSEISEQPLAWPEDSAISLAGFVVIASTISLPGSPDAAPGALDTVSTPTSPVFSAAPTPAAPEVPVVAPSVVSANVPQTLPPPGNADTVQTGAAAVALVPRTPDSDRQPDRPPATDPAIAAPVTPATVAIPTSAAAPPAWTRSVPVPSGSAVADPADEDPGRTLSADGPSSGSQTDPLLVKVVAPTQQVTKPIAPAAASTPRATTDATLQIEEMPDGWTVSPVSPGLAGTLAGSTVGPGLAAPATQVAQAATQLVQASVFQGKGTTEIALSPAELGHVRLSLQQDSQNPDRMVVVLSFERPETQDLFRRNADQLMAALRDAGFAGADISYGQLGSGTNGRDRERAEDTGDDLTTIAPAPVAAALVSLRPLADTSSLDLRM